MRYALPAAMLLLSGCGAIYTSPTISSDLPDGGYAVSVVAMTPRSIGTANRSPFTPRRAPVYSTMETPRPAAMVDAAVSVVLPPSADPGLYRIGVSDVVSMTLASYGTGLSDLVAGAPVDPRVQTYTVQDDNSIAIPNVGRVEIAGLTLAEAEERLFQALVGKQFDPGFSLDIAAFKSRRVNVGGLVAAPGPLPITLKPLYLADALQLAGGPVLNSGDVAQVRLLRGSKEYRVPLAMAYAEQGRRLRLADGDMVLVERSVDAEMQLERRRIALEETRLREQIGAIARDYVYLAGEARNPERLALPFGSRASLADILFGSGGISLRTGDYSQIYVLRLSGPKDVTAYRLNASNAVNLVASQSFEMRPGDVVFVAEQPVAAWNRTISQLFPSVVVQAATLIE